MNTKEEYENNLTDGKMGLAQASTHLLKYTLTREALLDTSIRPDYEAMEKQRILEEYERLERNSSAKTRNPMKHLIPKKKKRK